MHLIPYLLVPLAWVILILALRLAVQDLGDQLAQREGRAA